jgi:hypothetical protein
MKSKSDRSRAAAVLLVHLGSSALRAVVCLAGSARLLGYEMVGANGVGPRLTRSSGIWIPRLYRGRVLVTMGGARPPLR